MKQMEPIDPTAEMPPSLSSMLMGVMESMSPLLGLAAGYRERAIEMGFEADAANVMAVQLHHYMLSSLTKGAT